MQCQQPLCGTLLKCDLVSVPLHSHTVNLLGNLPLPCLDVLLIPKVQQGSIEYMGVNMDTVNMLLEFMEKRLDRVSIIGDSGVGEFAGGERVCRNQKARLQILFSWLG